MLFVSHCERLFARFNDAMTFHRRAMLQMMAGAAFAPAARAAFLQPTTLTEKLMLATIRIDGVDKRSRATKFGSGFFYRIAAPDGGAHDVIITNKHVLEGIEGVDLAFHTSADDGANGSQMIHVRGKLGAPWIAHPDKEVDLCALVLADALGPQRGRVFYHALDETHLPSARQMAEFDAIEDVLMVGYPQGLWDMRNNLPLLRRGSTASHPAIPYYIDEMKDVPLTVVDIAAFPGSSGSPVFIFNPHGYTDKFGVRREERRAILIGVLAAGPLMENDGEILIDDAPTQTNVAPRVNMPINLGYIINASQLSALAASVTRQIGVVDP